MLPEAQSEATAGRTGTGSQDHRARAWVQASHLWQGTSWRRSGRHALEREQEHQPGQELTQDQ